MIQLSKLRDFPYKLFIFILYGEADISYVRRQGLRFITETKPLQLRFDKRVAELHKAFRDLEKAGYVYNVSFECGRIRFYANLPKYMMLTTDADTLEAHVAEMRIPKGI